MSLATWCKHRTLEKRSTRRAERRNGPTEACAGKEDFTVILCAFLQARLRPRRGRTASLADTAMLGKSRRVIFNAEECKDRPTGGRGS